MTTDNVAYAYWRGDDVLDEPPEEEQDAEDLSMFVGGGSFFHDVPENPESVWGDGGNVLWAKGEALIITGPQGTGKTTTAMQVVRARLGLQSHVLGLPVETETRRVLYLAMDRPAQVRRAGYRIFRDDDKKFLEENLLIWPGPPLYDMAKRTDLLLTMCQKAGAGTVIVDSLKDAAIGLSDDAVGAGYNRARQTAIAEGIEVLELHHPVKNSAGGGEPRELKDVYGSTWITSGSGSVISLYGDAGDPIVSFRHLKQPMNEIGPFQVAHDHDTGHTTIHHAADPVAMVRATGAEGLTVKAAAAAIFDTDKPTSAQVEKARTRLKNLVKAGILVELTGQRGGTVKATTWHLAAGVA